MRRSHRLSEAGASTVWAPLGPRAGLRLLQLAAFFSSFDRFAVAPMLVTIAASLGASLSKVAATASLYYLLYGAMQPVLRGPGPRWRRARTAAGASARA
jgi:predicted MFS family arabinose efflux permease